MGRRRENPSGTIFHKEKEMKKRFLVMALVLRRAAGPVFAGGGTAAGMGKANAAAALSVILSGVINELVQNRDPYADTIPGTS
jgi:hypothetical protein